MEILVPVLFFFLAVWSSLGLFRLFRRVALAPPEAFSPDLEPSSVHFCPDDGRLDTNERVHGEFKTPLTFEES